jgi:hypothetical protein
VELVYPGATPAQRAACAENHEVPSELDPDITPCAQKGTKKTYEIFFIAFELSIVLGSPCNLVGFFGTFLGAGRDMRLR